LDELKEPGFADAIVRRFDKKTFDKGTESFDLGLLGRGGLPSDKAPLARMNLQNALCREFANGFLDGVGVDSEFLAEGSHRRKPVASDELLGSDGAFHSMDDLFIDRLARLKFDGKWKHRQEWKDSTRVLRVLTIAVHSAFAQVKNEEKFPYVAAARLRRLIVRMPVCRQRLAAMTNPTPIMAESRYPSAGLFRKGGA